MTSGCIISLGSINVDVQARAERWPEPGKLSLVRQLLVAGGGKAANVAYLATRLGVPAMLIARTGDDALAPLALAPLERAGVDLRATRAVRGMQTATAMILVGRDAEKSIALASNANDAWSDDDARSAAQAVTVAAAGSVLVCDLEISGAAVVRAMEAAREQGFPIVLDPSPPDRIEQVALRGLDYITPDAAEAESLTGIAVRTAHDAFRAGHALHQRGVRNVLVKLKDGGCAATGEHERFFVESPQVSAVDKTGAGDAFAGALAVAVLRRLALRDAVRMAVAASTIAVTRYGSQAAYPDRRELDECMQRVGEPGPAPA